MRVWVIIVFFGLGAISSAEPVKQKKIKAEHILRAQDVLRNPKFSAGSLQAVWNLNQAFLENPEIGNAYPPGYHLARPGSTQKVPERRLAVLNARNVKRYADAGLSGNVVSGYFGVDFGPFKGKIGNGSVSIGGSGRVLNVGVEGGLEVNLEALMQHGRLQGNWRSIKMALDEGGTVAAGMAQAVLAQAFANEDAFPGFKSILEESGLLSEINRPALGFDPEHPEKEIESFDHIIRNGRSYTKTEAEKLAEAVNGGLVGSVAHRTYQERQDRLGKNVETLEAVFGKSIDQITKKDIVDKLQNIEGKVDALAAALLPTEEELKELRKQNAAAARAAKAQSIGELTSSLANLGLLLAGDDEDAKKAIIVANAAVQISVIAIMAANGAYASSAGPAAPIAAIIAVVVSAIQSIVAMDAAKQENLRWDRLFNAIHGVRAMLDNHFRNHRQLISDKFDELFDRIGVLSQRVDVGIEQEMENYNDLENGLVWADIRASIHNDGNRLRAVERCVGDCKSGAEKVRDSLSGSNGNYREGFRAVYRHVVDGGRGHTMAGSQVPHQARKNPLAVRGQFPEWNGDEFINFQNSMLTQALRDRYVLSSERSRGGVLSPGKILTENELRRAYIDALRSSDKYGPKDSLTKKALIEELDKLLKENRPQNVSRFANSLAGHTLTPAINQEEWNRWAEEYVNLVEGHGIDVARDVNPRRKYCEFDKGLDRLRTIYELGYAQRKALRDVVKTEGGSWDVRAGLELLDQYERAREKVVDLRKHKISYYEQQALSKRPEAAIPTGEVGACEDSSFQGVGNGDEVVPAVPPKIKQFVSDRSEVEKLLSSAMKREIALGFLEAVAGLPEGRLRFCIEDFDVFGEHSKMRDGVEIGMGYLAAQVRLEFVTGGKSHPVMTSLVGVKGDGPVEWEARRPKLYFVKEAKNSEDLVTRSNIAREGITRGRHARHGMPRFVGDDPSEFLKKVPKFQQTLKIARNYDPEATIRVFSEPLRPQRDAVNIARETLPKLTKSEIRRSFIEGEKTVRTDVVSQVVETADEYRRIANLAAVSKVDVQNTKGTHEFRDAVAEWRGAKYNLLTYFKAALGEGVSERKSEANKLLKMLNAYDLVFLKGEADPITEHQLGLGFAKTVEDVLLRIGSMGEEKSRKNPIIADKTTETLLKVEALYESLRKDPYCSKSSLAVPLEFVRNRHKNATSDQSREVAVRKINDLLLKELESWRGHSHYLAALSRVLGKVGKDDMESVLSSLSKHYDFLVRSSKGPRLNGVVAVSLIEQSLLEGKLPSLELAHKTYAKGSKLLLAQLYEGGLSVVAEMTNQEFQKLLEEASSLADSFGEPRALAETHWHKTYYERVENMRRYRARWPENSRFNEIFRKAQGVMLNFGDAHKKAIDFQNKIARTVTEAKENGLPEGKELETLNDLRQEFVALRDKISPVLENFADEMGVLDRQFNPLYTKYKEWEASRP